MAEGSRIWYFEETNLFNLFCPHKSKHLGERHVFLEYQKDEFIYFEEDPSDKIYLIASGRVKIFSYNEQGEEFVKAILGKGEIFGEQSILGEGQRTDFAQAIEPATICRMHFGRTLGNDARQSSPEPLYSQAYQLAIQALRTQTGAAFVERYQNTPACILVRLCTRRRDSKGKRGAYQQPPDTQRHSQACRQFKANRAHLAQ